MNNNRGLGTCSVLTLIFIVLKILKVITWKWIWVLCPMWIEILIILLVFIITEFIDWL